MNLSGRNRSGVPPTDFFFASVDAIGSGHPTLHPSAHHRPHPSCNRTSRFVTFTATPDGTRRACLADRSSPLG